MLTAIIEAQQLYENIDNDDWLVLDCQFDLMNKTAGYEAYLAGHIPGAVYVRLDKELSDHTASTGGRHPLPAKEDLVKLFSSLGISSDTYVVVYDNSAAAIAARLWWLLRYAGHKNVAVLNGGLNSWQLVGYETETIEGAAKAADFCADFNDTMLIPLNEVLQSELLIDSREPERYRGEHEPIDPIAGHIPGAVNRFWKDNLTDSVKFKSAQSLNTELSDLFADTGPEEAVFYCGSGVTACHNILATVYAGLPMPRLYPGSWSEWCADADRPIAKG